MSAHSLFLDLSSLGTVFLDNDNREMSWGKDAIFGKSIPTLCDDQGLAHFSAAFF